MSAALLAMALNSSVAAFSVQDLNRSGSRILLMSGRSENDPALAEQRRDLESWRRGAEDRDLVIVEIGAKHAMQWFRGADRGATGDDVATLRHRYQLAPAC